MLFAEYITHRLSFRFDAGTSKGILHERKIFVIKLHFTIRPDVAGYGECATIPHISPDDHPDYERYLKHTCAQINRSQTSHLSSWEDPINWVYRVLDSCMPEDFPSINFGFETALLDLVHGGKRIIFPSDYVKGKIRLPINGLVWMNTIEQMRKEAFSKIQDGFQCIKFKIGAINWEEELDLLHEIRNSEHGKEIILRVDANGAFHPETALDKLNQLAHLNLHSIEQPIAKGQWQAMAKLCHESPFPIALDEELSGLKTKEEKELLLDTIKPQYIVLKPSMVGGLAHTAEWIELAQARNIGWWITSALESNIGLNAIAQFTAQYDFQMHQGLGTGNLYEVNFNSPIQVKNAYLQYNPRMAWENLDSWWASSK